MLNFDAKMKIGIAYSAGHFEGEYSPPDGKEIARGSYIVFIDHGIPKHMKTHVFSVWTLVENWIGAKLGEVRWYGPWRKYAFDANCKLEEVCMDDISEFIMGQTMAHKEAQTQKNAAV